MGQQLAHQPEHVNHRGDVFLRRGFETKLTNNAIVAQAAFTSMAAT